MVANMGAGASRTGTHVGFFSENSLTRAGECAR
jgi:hypothetical protein